MCLLKLVILAQTVLEIYSSEAVGCGIFDRFLNFDNCQLEVVSDVISAIADQDGRMDVCANFGDFRLKLADASFSVIIRTSINFDRNHVVTSYLVCL